MIKWLKSLNKIGIASFLMMVFVVVFYSYSLISYAFYSKKIEQTNKNNIASACFSLEFTEQTGSVDLNNTSPMTKQKAYASKDPYTFTITNKCNTDMYYNITLNTTGNSDLDRFLTYELQDSSSNTLSSSILSEATTYEPYNNYRYTEDNVNYYDIISSYTLYNGMLAKAVMDNTNTNVITPGETKQFKLYLWMNEDVTSEEAMGKEFTGKVIVTSSTKSFQSNTKKCIRATTLHTENCEQTGDDEYCSGAGYTASGSKGTTTITYGNLGTSGTLASGDAFDCDINGDGAYDSETERFYYVSTVNNGITQDTNTAVLIYYNDYVTSTAVYASQSDTGLSINSSEKGPITAIKNLPTINDWSTTLTTTTRNITHEDNTVRVPNFEYKVNGIDLAARLLTIQEIQSACNLEAGSFTTGELDNCRYLLENTKYASSNNQTYGTWLESTVSYRSSCSWFVSGRHRYIGIDIVKYGYGARPAIEIPLTDIDY